jgi:nicotinate-nucleotide adenylyltransferase
MSRRIGVFGGTFDPVHLAHLILAEQCREAGRLDEVWFVPAAAPPHKQGQPITPFERRVEMLELATAGNPHFLIDTSEQKRAGPSFTADTLDEFRRRHLQDEFFLIIGSDSLRELPGWREPRRIVEHAGLLVMQRAQNPMPSAEELRSALALPAETQLRLILVPSPPTVDISSRDLRQRARDGRSIRYLVPRAVECYIHEKRLYRDDPGRVIGGDVEQSSA